MNNDQLIRTIKRLIRHHPRRSTEDTIGVLMWDGVFHEMTEEEMCALARAIDAAELTLPTDRNLP